MYVYRIIIIIINIIRHLMREVVEEAEAEWGKSTQEMSKKKKSVKLSLSSVTQSHSHSYALTEFICICLFVIIIQQPKSKYKSKKKKKYSKYKWNHYIQYTYVCTIMYTCRLGVARVVRVYVVCRVYSEHIYTYRYTYKLRRHDKNLSQLRPLDK